MLRTTADPVPSTITERVSAVFTRLRQRTIETALANRSATTPAWHLELVGNYRMTSCASCGEVVDPLWRLCQHCGNPTR
jgi:hypothetical protein